MKVIDMFTKDMEIQAMKYLVGQQIFCSFTNEVLDFRTATFIEPMAGLTSVYSPVVSEDKWEEIKTKIEASGVPVQRIYNLKTIKEAVEDTQS